MPAGFQLLAPVIRRQTENGIKLFVRLPTVIGIGTQDENKCEDLFRFGKTSWRGGAPLVGIDSVLTDGDVLKRRFVGKAMMDSLSELASVGKRRKRVYD